MTVKELQEKLYYCDTDAEVYIEPAINTTTCDSVEYDEEENKVFLS